LVEAVAAFRRAAEWGHRRAAFMLAECLRHGTGAAVDVPQAVGWYRKAATLLDAKLILGDIFHFGQGVPPNPVEAAHWYAQAANRHKDPYAMYSYGFCLMYGHGTAPDAEAAVGWLRQAALQDEADAQYELGMAYFLGRGLKRNPRFAAKWLRASARQGNESAAVFLQRMERGKQLS